MSHKKPHPGPFGGYAVKHMIEAVEEKMAAGEPIGDTQTPKAQPAPEKGSASRE